MCVCVQEATSLVKSRAGGGAKPSKAEGKKEKGQKTGGASKDGVITLTDDNFGAFPPVCVYVCLCWGVMWLRLLWSSGCVSERVCVCLLACV